MHLPPFVPYAAVSAGMKMFFLVVLVALLAVSRSSAADIVAEQAKDHVGKWCTVTGIVEHVGHSPKAVFLDFGGRYPNQVFTAVSFSIPYEELAKLEGKRVTVGGTVKIYRGKPEIVVAKMDQIACGG